MSTMMRPLKRCRLDDVMRHGQRRLDLGTFASGTSIYRNRLHEGERLQDGHVSISNLVPSGAVSALFTTFVGPEVGWLESFLDGVPQIVVVQHDMQHDPPNVIGAATVSPLSQNNPGWISLNIQPHTGGCLHSKVMLFRCDAGLRVVVCGSNLYQEQWESDRDCLWVQDFFTVAAEHGSSISSTESKFQRNLCAFLKDLTCCKDASDQAIITERLNGLWDAIDFAPAVARFVFSMPRRKGDPKTRGGWRLLAESVHELVASSKKSEKPGAHKRSDDVPKTSPSATPPVQLFIMAGSFGNVEPDFLLQMYQAMMGSAASVPAKTTWQDMAQFKIRCLWPSRQTALSMNFHSIINNIRAIPMKYWKTIPDASKRQIFFDAPPNPTELGLPHLECHPVSHSKVMLKTGDADFDVIYVGSHNFSKAAWGLRGTMPNNVEAGIVLVAPKMDTVSSSPVTDEWIRRLPCVLPEPDALSPASYIPASAHMGVREAYQSGKIDEAFQMLEKYLKST